MPDYIKNDWINYNKKNLEIKHVDEMIHILDNIPILNSNNKLDEVNLIKKNILKSIRRELVIKLV